MEFIMNTNQKDNSIKITPIAKIRTDFSSKFGIPRQSGLVDSLTAEIIFEPPFRLPEMLRGIENFSHLWLIWQFTESGDIWHPTVRPPRLGGNTRVGVFASRSPFRPNPLGMSCVKLVSVNRDTPNGITLTVSGADMLDGTPIFDIKPYIPLADLRADATQGYTEITKEHALSVVFPGELLEKLPNSKRDAASAILTGDPRPGYENDPDKKYGLEFAGFDIGFAVCDNTLTVFRVDIIEG